MRSSISFLIYYITGTTTQSIVILKVQLLWRIQTFCALRQVMQKQVWEGEMLKIWHTAEREHQLFFSSKRSKNCNGNTQLASLWAIRPPLQLCFIQIWNVTSKLWQKVFTSPCLATRRALIQHRDHSEDNKCWCCSRAVAKYYEDGTGGQKPDHTPSVTFCTPIFI